MSGGSNMSVNRRIREVRHFLNLSQAKFADNLCMSGGYFAAIELENRRAHDRLIRLICFAYGVNEHWLRTGEGQMFDKATDAKADLARKIFRELKPEYKDCAMGLAQRLLEIQQSEA